MWWCFFSCAVVSWDKQVRSLHTVLQCKMQAAQLRSVLGVHTGLTLQWYQNADIRRSAETVNRDSIYLHSIFCVSARVRIGQRMSTGILRVYSSVGRAIGC